MISRLLLIAPAAASAVALSGCASVTVRDVAAPRTTSPSGPPKTFYVAPFSIERASIKEHPMRKHPGQLGREAQQLIAK